MNKPPKPHSLIPGLAELSTLVNGTILECDEEGARRALREIAAMASALATPSDRTTAEEVWQLAVSFALASLLDEFSKLPMAEASIGTLRGYVRRLDDSLFGGFALYARLRERERGASRASVHEPSGTTLSDLGLD